ncbi:MAG TPA: S53 family peptidase [Actinocrinis sp.]|nr:S53 family peptidase [Actinocrinis sp.]
MAFAGAAGGSGSGSNEGTPPKPCSEYFGEFIASRYPAAFGAHLPFAVCGYTPAQLRSAYDTDAANGHGVTVAIVDAYGSPTIEDDADQYAGRHGDEPFGVGQYSEQVNPQAWTLQDLCGGTDSWAAEQTLDVEAVHALAPDARILYYGANSCQDSDLLAALTDIIGHHRADVVTASWGAPIHSAGGDISADVIARYDRLFQIAALEGISIDFSSGDCGENAPTSTCGGPQGSGSSEPQTTYPASDPWVTAVGGTSLEIGRDGDLEGQTAWGTRAWRLAGNAKAGASAANVGNARSGAKSAGEGAGDPPGPQWQPLGWIFGGGGGTSADFAQPWYQVGRVPAALSGTLLTGAPAATPRRTVPDLALDADPFTGMLVGQTVQSTNGSGKSGGADGTIRRTKEANAYKEAAVGGTSLASPLLAGLEADAIEANGGADLGFVNPSLYVDSHAALLLDVTGIMQGRKAVGASPIGQIYPPIPGKPAVLAALGDDGPLLATPGYDTATGLGAPGDDFPQRLGAR